MTLKQASNLADMSQNTLKNLIKKGENGDERYIELYEVYKDKYVPNQLNVFLEKIKKSKYKKALKSAHLTDDELKKYYVEGLAGNETFNDFSNQYFEFKLENYTKEMIIKGKTPSRAARNSNFIQEDFEYRKDEIDKVLIEKQLEIILPLVSEGFHLKYVANKINVDVEVLFDWYIKGYEGDKTFEEFSETYWESRMEASIKDFQSIFDNGISEGFFLRHILRKNVLPEYKFWKRLNLFEINKDNKLLTDEEQLEIYVDKVLDVRENVENILKLADEESDLDLPIDRIIEDVDDADLKRHINHVLSKDSDEDG